MGIKERIIEYCKSKNIAISRFEKESGLSNAYISKFKGNLGAEKLENILSAFTDLNREWLLYGEGEMIRATKTYDKIIRKENEIPLIPLFARAGVLDDFMMSVHEYDCEKIVSPVKGVDFAIAISGDSMEPEIPNGSVALIKKINERAFIDYSKVYIMDTCNGVVVKRVMPGKDESTLVCESINTKYPPFDVCRKDIYSMYVVVMVMTMK